MVTVTSAPTYLHNAQSQSGAARQGLSGEKSEPVGNAACLLSGTKTSFFSELQRTRFPRKNADNSLNNFTPQKSQSKDVLNPGGTCLQSVWFYVFVINTCALAEVTLRKSSLNSVRSNMGRRRRSIQMIVDRAVARVDGPTIKSRRNSTQSSGAGEWVRGAGVNPSVLFFVAPDWLWSPFVNKQAPPSFTSHLGSLAPVLAARWQ